MNKTRISLLLALLILSLCAVPAFATEVHPSQYGDLNGQRAAEIEEALRNNAIPPYYTEQPQQAPVNQQQAPVNQQQEAYYPVYEVPAYSGDVIYEDGTIVRGGQISSGSSSSGSSSSTQSLDWYSVGQALISQYPNISVYDVNTGVTWGAKYINGKNHADIIPASEGDANKLASNNITGSYVRRPVVVTINGQKYAGSMYAVGHGETSYCSYFSGVMCIHFTGSQTHGSKTVDSDHQKAIQDALTSGY